MTQPQSGSLNPRDAYFLQAFVCDQLPKDMQSICQPFYDLASSLLKSLPDNSDRAASLQKLIETKDCAVRSFLHP